MKAVVRTGALLTRNHWRTFASTTARRIDSAEPVTSATAAASTVKPMSMKEGWLYVDTVFPVRIASWDIRYWVGILRQDHLTEAIRSMLSTSGVPNFTLTSLEPQVNDGGLFVRYKYQGPDNDDTAVRVIEEQLRTSLADQGGIPSWANLGRSEVWAVKGSPWREDLRRFPTPILKISFDGPDIPEEELWNIFRPFGRILEVSQPVNGPPGTPRFSNVSFRSMRSATVARNVMHNCAFTIDGKTTTLKTGYAQLIQAHVVRDWITGHPRIVLPIVVFLLGSLTYAIFDPIRVWMVQAKILNWFDLQEYSLFRWLKENTPSLSSGTYGTLKLSNVAEVWRDRTEAQETIKKFLAEYPSCTITFIHGPQGSGKTALVSEALTSLEKRSLLIDCGPIIRHKDSGSKMITVLAQQTGYWPVFTFFNSIANLIDLASVGLIGQKAGMSVSVTDQLKQILDVVGRSLGNVHAYHEKETEDKAKRQESLRQQRERLKKIQRGEWHDGRLDCVAGNGIMSELGIGDEKFGPDDADVGIEETVPLDPEVLEESESDADLDAVKSLPVVVIRGFEDKVGGKSELLDVIAQWATGLVDNKIAHVIVLSDNRENAKRLTKVNHSRPLNTITLSDADAETALAFVQQKLKEAKLDIELTSKTTASIERLGGRASDLDNLIYKVRGGSSIEDAVEDIIVRGVGELRKNAFGEDAEDAKELPWTRAQAWGLMKRLAKEGEIPYHDTLMNFPFKGEEMALRNMEHGELITISTHNGRPSTIRPGKPVYRFVFERVVGDTVFSASQDIDYNKQLIAASESTIKACEEELLRLTEIGEHTRSSIFGTDRAVGVRVRYLLNAMGEASAKIESLERVNAKLRKSLTNR